ncbi:hypothetical protein Nepgr_028732 [Nepenthes gracilis]|uniref:CRIB domain-containing protein n=1 Tax=Nepenthes gracilis TaxID=150966 RepID=A0AAD3TCU0_NEPGR|nr:hypothetical protein Nepgr_028732 [Nepenthes gracilis]
MKGICKGIKYISKLFVVKEREMEIGCPTDVKHVAHIGWDGPDVNAPSWMSEFKIAADFSVASIGSMDGSRDPTWSSQDLERLMGRLPSSNVFNSLPPTNVPGIPKKQKLKKKKPSSSPEAVNFFYQIKLIKRLISYIEGFDCRRKRGGEE